MEDSVELSEKVNKGITRNEEGLSRALETLIGQI